MAFRTVPTVSCHKQFERGRSTSIVLGGNLKVKFVMDITFALREYMLSCNGYYTAGGER